jgi:hypothetical protein
MAKQTFTTGQVLTAAQMTSLQQTAMLGGAASAKTASYTLVAADAGTAVSMSNASATTITVNTALFAAGDTVNITNLGAGVCTITAGTATVNSSASLALAQYESGTLDFTSTSAAIFIKGAGAAAATGANYALLSTTTLSGAATRTVSGISGINSLYIYINDASSASASSDFNLRLNTDTGSNYKFFGLSLKNNADVVYRVDSASSTSVTLANIGNAGGTANILIKIDGTNAVGIKPINVAGAGTDTNGEGRVMNAIYTGTSTISSVSLISSVGNFDGGTMYVYGG